jgi:NADH-quinone oxidoreductase subunit E
MNEKICFSAETLNLVKKIISHYPEGRQKSALIPVLHLAQAEFGGWLSREVMDYVAGLLNIKPIEVYEVATFYTMFNLQPTGRCVIEVCRTGPCWLMGAEEIIAYLENKLGIKVGETTADGKFTLKTTECLAACGNAPVIQVGEKYYENMNNEKIDKLLNEFDN